MPPQTIATPIIDLNNVRKRIGVHTLAYDQLTSRQATDIENEIGDPLYSNWYAMCLQNGVSCGSFLKIEKMSEGSTKANVVVKYLGPFFGYGN
jgi:hypothetical protein